ncbi:MULTISPECIES: sensor domain-containing diguanylate cyclase [Halomonadaceae]|uniref:diguanylate cyclase n=1 Tax=Vreelandella halophila TaxID=86177 RepID=A0A9X4YAD1_9GAMM|nr:MULTISPECIES: diguanylate cyclase [Halomonas]MYL26117.1 diguanylate cyclase [Halomonas utahensis]MYL73321.1 diguanylate cyclase [Halomonas sp. 22501_18_FS]
MQEGDAVFFREAPATDLSQMDSRALLTILDNMDALVYVADMETHELLFMNDYGRRIWGEPAGRKCWAVLQDRDSPCPFCTNSQLVNAEREAAEPLVWEFRNQTNGRWYQCRDQAIQWPDGRLVRLEIATDITERREMEEALRAERERADALAREDELTGLNNRRAFFEAAEKLLARARRSDRSLSLVQFDLDWFKRINDEHGHEAGDRLLRHIGQLIGNCVREGDVAARVGGEEFVLLLPDTDQDEARILANRLRQCLSSSSVACRDATVSASASFGVSSLIPADDGVDDLMARADRALYRAKQAGRDCVYG